MLECSSLKPGEATDWDQLSQPLKSFNGDLYVEVTMGGNTGKKYAESGKREVRQGNWKNSGNWEKMIKIIQNCINLFFNRKCTKRRQPPQKWELRFRQKEEGSLPPISSSQH